MFASIVTCIDLFHDFCFEFLYYILIFECIMLLGWKYLGRFWYRTGGVYCSFSADRRPKVSAEGLCIIMCTTVSLPGQMVHLQHYIVWFNPWCLPILNCCSGYVGTLYQCSVKRHVSDFAFHNSGNWMPCMLIFQAENVIVQLNKTFPDDGLLPIYIDPERGTTAYSTITFGAMGDR